MQEHNLGRRAETPRDVPRTQDWIGAHVEPHERPYHHAEYSSERYPGIGFAKTRQALTPRRPEMAARSLRRKGRTSRDGGKAVRHSTMLVSFAAESAEVFEPPPPAFQAMTPVTPSTCV